MSQKCSTHGDEKISVGEPHWKRSLSRPRHRLDDNIKIDYREITLQIAERIDLAQDVVGWRTFMNTIMNFRDP
jgi:hypothetical protein